MFKGKKLFLLSFITAGAICFLLMWSFFGRAVCTELVKKELLKIQTSLNDAGYDIAYEELQFSPSLFYLLKIRDFKIYSLDTDNYKEWHIPELKVRSGVLDPNEISIVTPYNHYIQTSGKTYITDFPRLSIKLKLAEGIGLKNITVTAKNVDIEGLVSIDDLKFAAQRMAPQKISEFTPFFENHIEARGIKISDDINLPISKTIDRFYVNANVVGVVKSADTYKQSILSWQAHGGVIDVKKIILNCDTLSLVGRGDLYFNENFEPNLHLTASSKGLIEFIQDFQDVDVLDNKGVFVVKILLNSKAFKINENDVYRTVTTPININPNEITIENIVIKKLK